MLIFAENYTINMKVCFVIESIFSYGGVQRVTAVIAKELAKTAEVTIMTFDKINNKNTNIYELDEANISYEFLEYPTVNCLKEKCCKAYSLMYRKVLPQCNATHALYAHSSFPSERRRVLIEHLNAHSFDAIIAVHAPIATRIAAIRSQLRCKNLIGWIHNSYDAMFSKGSGYAGSELERYFVYQFHKLSHTVVLCQCDVSPYQQKFGFTPKVIYNPLTLTPGETSTGHSKKFLAVGRFSPQHKGFDILIKAFALFAQNNLDWTLDIVGEGPEEESFRSLIAKYNMEGRITIHPFTKEIQKYYSEAQVYVLSSRWEGFGLVLVEAMAHGLPVISSDLPTSKEIMGDFGIYFKNGDINGLAYCMQKATKIDWEKKSSEALEIAKRFSIKTIVQQWKDIINE